MPRATILLAEDDDSLRSFLARALERAGHEVRTCADGDEALAALNEGPFDLLLTDIVMPGADGIEVARVAAAQTPGLPIMVAKLDPPVARQVLGTLLVLVGRLEQPQALLDLVCGLVRFHVSPVFRLFTCRPART